MAGRVQRAFRAVFAPGEAREDWRIIRAFSEVLGHTLPYDTLEQLRAHMAQVNPVFAMNGGSAQRLAGTTGGQAAPASGQAGELMPAPFRPVIQDYYQTNVISRASQTMAECSKVYGVAPAVAAE
jgi:NADH-quinone oxidoreductase subunit G